MKGQLISNVALPCSKARRAWSSLALASDGSAAGEWASLAMMSAACWAGGPSVTLSPFRIDPPADWTRELNQTVTPSYCAPWISMYGAFLIFEAVSMSPVHVSGGLLTRSLRYQSSCVLEFAGA